MSTTNPMTPAGSPATWHCPYRQASQLQQALEPGKMRVAFLLGAGCPLAVRVEDGSGTKPLIPAIEGLTAQVRSLLESSKPPAAGFDFVLKRLADVGQVNPTVEEILSHVRGLQSVIGASIIDGLSKKMLEDLEAGICDFTTQIVQKRLPSNNTAYHQLAAGIKGIKRAHAVEIFTSNYDLLME